MIESRILYVISGRSFASTRLGRKISEVIKCWLDSGVKLDVVCGGDSKQNEIVKPLSYGNQAYFNKSYRNKKWLLPLVISLSELKDIIHDIQFYFKLKKQFTSNHHDLVWERSSRLHIAGLMFAKKQGIPFVLEWKDNLVNYRWSLFKPLALFIEKIKIISSDFIVVESEVLKSQIEAKGIAPNKIFVAYNAVNAEEFSCQNSETFALKEKFAVKDDDLLIGYLGSYAFYHSPDLLIEAANLTRNIPAIKYFMVGNGKHHRECLKLAKHYNLFDITIFFIDGVPKEQVPSLLNELDVTVLPGSTDIICPIKVFEYMSAKKPVLLPDYKCNKEVITDNEDGFFFKALDFQNLAKKIIYLKENVNVRENLGIQAREKVIKEYSWEATWGKTLNKILGGIGALKNDI